MKSFLKFNRAHISSAILGAMLSIAIVSPASALPGGYILTGPAYNFSSAGEMNQFAQQKATENCRNLLRDQRWVGQVIKFVPDTGHGGKFGSALQHTCKAAP